MKLLSAYFLLFCAILVAVPGRGGRQPSGDQAAAGVAFLLAPEPAPWEKLDVRDARNRPIQTPQAADALATLFRENIVFLTVFAELPSAAKSRTWLETISYLFHNRFYRSLQAVIELTVLAISSASRRFVHNVDKLWITFSVGKFTPATPISARHLLRTPQSIPQRC